MRGHAPFRNVAPPAAAVATAVARLASAPYALPSWWVASRGLASELGLSSLDSLRGVMVHPPDPPEGFAVWNWIQRVQVAAALILAHLRSLWRGAVGRRTLVSIASGPMDWTVEAAVLSLAQLAIQDGNAIQAVSSAFASLEARIPHQGYCCYAYALACNWQRLPGLTAERPQHLEGWRSSLEE